MKGKVYLVGAGPGDYKLLTLKGLECIKEADVIVYDRLANKNYLKEAKPNCQFIYVGKASSHHTLPQEEINRVIVEHAKEGKVVTRLKGGDPYVFGRGGEEGEILKAEGIEFEVVPGITSAIGGLCYAGIPITHRDHASSFHVVTGHLRADDKQNPELNWNALANVNGTLVFLMGIANLKQISDNLIKEGKSKETPVALISWATRSNQKVIVSTLEEVHETALKEKVKPPTLIVVGSVVNLRETLNFFENKPLFGKNIIVTRSRTQNSSIVEKIMDLGGNPIEIPTIKIEKFKNNVALQEAIRNLKNYTYLVLTSKNAVDIFFDQLEELDLDVRALAHLKVCAIGTATAREMKARGIKADVVPKEFVAESLYEELKSSLTSKDKILIPRAKNARDFLVEKLEEICSVHEIHTYESKMDLSQKGELLEILNHESIDYITFASSSSVKNFVEIIGKENLDKIKNSKLISIGPMTSSALLEVELDVYKEAKQATIDHLLQTMIAD